MTKYTQKQLGEMVKDGIAENVSNYNMEMVKELKNKDGWLDQVGYASKVITLADYMLLQAVHKQYIYFKRVGNVSFILLIFRH